MSQVGVTLPGGLSLCGVGTDGGLLENWIAAKKTNHNMGIY